jgi:hypothetical protein
MCQIVVNEGGYPSRRPVLMIGQNPPDRFAVPVIWIPARIEHRPDVIVERANPGTVVFIN